VNAYIREAFVALLGNFLTFDLTYEKPFTHDSAQVKRLTLVKKSNKSV
jgi:hypothetical protein